jgi:hypothetical protein
VKLTKQNKTKQINRERWTHTHKETNRKRNKQTNKETQKKIPGSGKIEISVLVVLVLLLQHPVLVLVFKQRLSLSLVGWLRSLASVFLCLSAAAAWSAPPSVGCGSLSLYIVLRFWNQLCSPPALLLWSWVFTVLDYWGLVSLPCPLSLGQGQRSVSWLPGVSVL